MGQLTPDHSPEMYSPLLVSLTLNKQLNFTAVWQFSGNGLTLEQGQCEQQRP